MNDGRPILVTGAGGGTGGVGRSVVEILRGQDLPVRAMVHREDERAKKLRGTGAEVVVGDLTQPADVIRVLAGCARIYFALSVSASYLEATVTVAAAARELGAVEVFVNMSQMTVSQMDLRSSEESMQQRQQWLGEQALNWSGLPVVHVRPTVFMENPLFAMLAGATVSRDDIIRLPFGSGRTSPIAARDVADVVAAILTAPEGHIGHVYELTGAASRDLNAIAEELSATLGRKIRYEDVPYDSWRDHDLAALGLPPHVEQHIATMARLHAENRYDRLTRDVQAITGHAPRGLGDFVRQRHTARAN